MRTCLSTAVLALVAITFGVNTDLRDVLACGGDPIPPICGKTLGFTMAVPGVVKNGPDEIVLDVPTVTFLGLVEIPPGSGACPEPPYEATVELTLDCGRFPGGSNTVSFEISTGYNFKDVPIVIPPGPSRKCILGAKMTVTFSDDMKISREAQQCICIVDCSPKDPALPRLDLSPVVAGSDIARVHSGDQTSHRYHIANNDDAQTFRGLLEVVSENESRRPVDESADPPPPGMGVFAVSDPRFGDDFPIAFGDRLNGGCIILPPEPQNTVLPTLRREIILGPCESIEVEVVARPWGMCAHGSCGKVTVLLDGRFSDDTFGFACAGAVVAVDNTVTPRLAWEDSGAVATVDAEPGGSLLFENGLAPVLGVPIPSWGAKLEDPIIRVLGNPLPMVQAIQAHVIAMTPPPAGIPPPCEYKGRFESSNRTAKPGPEWSVGSFFEVSYRIDFTDPQGKPVIPVKSMGFVEGVPHGFERTGPIAMGEATVPDSSGKPVFPADIFHQISGEAVALDATGASYTVPIGFSDPVATPDGSGFTVDLGAVASPTLPQPPPGGGGGAGGVADPIVEVRLFADLSSFVRQGPVTPCPQTEITDLVCRSDGQQVCLFWNHSPQKCDCDKIEVRDGAGNVILALPGDATTACIPCERLQAPTGILCVVCIAPDGTETRACCDYDCKPCPDIKIVRCDVNADGKLVLAWDRPPDGCCETIVVRDDAGNVIATIPGTASGFAIPCDALPARTGTICVECVDPSGAVASRDCCDYVCPPPDCPPIQIVRCEVIDGGALGPVLRLEWTPLPDGCCDRIRIADANGNEVLLLAPTVTSAEIPCANLPVTGTICVECVTVASDGSFQVESTACCDYACPCPPLEILRCDVVDDPLVGPKLVVEWTPQPPECCQEVRVAIDGVGIESFVAGEGMFMIPCSDPRVPPSGEVCLICVAPDQTTTQVCCTYKCPPPECPPLEIVRCAVADDPDAGPVLVVGWNPIPPECCDAYRVTIDGVVIAQLPNDAPPVVTIPCSDDRLPPVGTICIQCVKDNEVVDEDCCDYVCRCPPIQVACDPAGDVVVVAWNALPVECCEKVRIRDGPTGPVIAEVDAGLGSVTLKCEDLPRRAGTLCVECLDPAGNVTSSDCCDYQCPPCPQPEILRCEVIDGKVIVVWSPLPRNCCEKIEILHRPTNTIVGEVAGTDTMFMIDCAALPTPVGELCLVCVDPSGIRDPQPPCCEYRCEPDCPPLQAGCDIVADDNGQPKFLMVWNAMPDECCDRFVIRTSDGQVVGTALAGETMFMISCRELVEIAGTAAGTVCVVCIAPDGTERAEACCEFECPPPDGGGQLPGDCNQDRMVDIADDICTLTHLFLSFPPVLRCPEALDCNGDGALNIADAIWSLVFKFRGGPPPVLGTACRFVSGCPHLCNP